MLKTTASALLASLLLLMSGCQSSSTTPPSPSVVTVGCQPPPAPDAWFMVPREPNLTQRMLNEFSE